MVSLVQCNNSLIQYLSICTQNIPLYMPSKNTAQRLCVYKCKRVQNATNADVERKELQKTINGRFRH